MLLSFRRRHLQRQQQQQQGKKEVVCPVCRQNAVEGKIIQCNADDCPHQAFHLNCVGLDEVPKEDWYFNKEFHLAVERVHTTTLMMVANNPVDIMPLVNFAILSLFFFLDSFYDLMHEDIGSLLLGGARKIEVVVLW
ncbi:hypothetical protein BDA99DRAFT_537430 [Phascolomyces articulosus]|uniref:Zinc finger PHD-type domain-containing protein n=1 Tax=Phascolomyces articulosus TaxID=60185 RepID=A0AAD5KE39_9FUNG|nr:hypothetical protein BDA99DRAFT_537430 [Phascolomyces articulosus]